ncbi:5'-nucleotidase C-terminal domain-containing protein [Carboxylicivirga taeanensis]|uniref:5'-nucleotidase C-terminal domain-containing protein n=1 Tax=Carboxylicivirga taeanensis TaxID=1416875 RepID=UPI003F6E1836
MRLLEKYIIFGFLGGLLFVLGCNSPGYKSNKIEASYLPTDSLVGQDAAMEATIKPYRDSLKTEMQRVIGEAEQELRGGQPEGLLSNFVADLMLTECELHTTGVKPDISIVNVKGLRVPINKGEITVESIYQLMPFENEIVYLTMSPEQIRELFNFMASVDGDGMGGASFGIKDGKAMSIQVGGRPLENRNYIVATSDYLADGGDHFNVFLSAVSREETGLKLRDAILQHVERLTTDNKLVNSQLDKRIYYAE